MSPVGHRRWVIARAAECQQHVAADARTQMLSATVRRAEVLLHRARRTEMPRIGSFHHPAPGPCNPRARETDDVAGKSIRLSVPLLLPGTSITAAQLPSFGIVIREFSCHATHGAQKTIVVVIVGRCARLKSSDTGRQMAGCRCQMHRAGWQTLHDLGLSPFQIAYCGAIFDQSQPCRHLHFFVMLEHDPVRSRDSSRPRPRKHLVGWSALRCSSS